MIRILLFFLTFLLLSGCVDEEINSSKHAPVVNSFKVKPSIAQPGVKVSFCADEILDNEDSYENLQVCWSFLGDDVFTEYTTDKHAEFTYQATGCYFPTLKVRDSHSMTQIGKMIVVVVNDTNNKPPQKPELLYPVVEASIFGNDVTFMWECTPDPENDPVTYDLWIGHLRNDLKKVSTTVTTGPVCETTLNIKESSNYYWTISVKDSPNGNHTFSELRKFHITCE